MDADTVAVRSGEVSAPRAARSTSLAVVAKILGSLLGAVAAGFIARAVSPGEFGALLLGMAIAGLVGVLGDFGASTVTAREMALRPSEAGSLAGTLVWFRLAGTLLCGAAGAAVGLLVGGAEREVFYSAYVSVLASPLMGLVVVPTTRLRILQSQIPGLVQSVLWVAVAVAGSVAGVSAVAFGLAYAASNVAGSAAAVLVARRTAAPRFARAWREVPALWRQCRLVGMSTALFLGYHKGDTVIVQGLAGNVQTALYTGAYRLIETANLFANTVYSGLIPAATRRRDNPSAVRAIALEFAGLAGALGAFLMFVLAGPAVSLLYGSSYGDMVPVVAVGSIVAGAFVLEVALNQLLVASGVVRPQARLSLATLVAQTAGVFAVTGSLGALGAIYVSAVVQVFRITVLVAVARRCEFALPSGPWVRALGVAVSGCAVHVILSGLFGDSVSVPAAMVVVFAGVFVARPAPAAFAVARTMLLSRAAPAASGD